MTILRTVSLILASAVVLASAATAQVGSRDGSRDGSRGDGTRERRGERPNTPTVRPQQVPPVVVRPVTPPVLRPVAPPVVRPVVRPVPPPVVYERGRPNGFWWRQRHNERHFRGHRERRWYRWW